MELHSSLSPPLHGSVRAPPSKSVTHRALLLALLADGASTLRNPLRSADTESTMHAISLMGGRIYEDRDLRIEPEFHQAEDVIDARNSGTTARLMASVCALPGGYAAITGDSSLRRRPMAPLITAVRQLGGHAFSMLGNGRLPAVFGGRMRGKEAKLRADMSSQFLSSLAISCPLKDSDTAIRLQGMLQSADYFRMTLQMCSYFGVRQVFEDGTLYCSGGRRYRGRSITIPGDFSSASFLFAASAVTGGDITVTSLSTRFAQADARILEMLAEAGCKVRKGRDRIHISGKAESSGCFDCSQSPDIFPVMCVVASSVKGRSTVIGSSALRFKETDRIMSTCSMLRSIGVQFREEGGGIEIIGGSVRGGRVDSGGDHRIAMSACVAGLISERGIRVEGDTPSVSYPSFLEDIRSLGGRIDVL